MRIVVQRVTEAHVEAGGETVGAIGRGLLVLVGVAIPDTPADADYLAGKVVGLRIFPDQDGKMNRSVVEAGGALLVISQFTLYGDCRKGRRPSFDMAAGAEQARALYERFLDGCRARNVPVRSGVFQASMAVHLINDGPVTIICESSRQGLQKPD